VPILIFIWLLDGNHRFPFVNDAHFPSHPLHMSKAAKKQEPGWAATVFRATDFTLAAMYLVGGVMLAVCGALFGAVALLTAMEFLGNYLIWLLEFLAYYMFKYVSADRRVITLVWIGIVACLWATAVAVLYATRQAAARRMGRAALAHATEK